MKKVILILIFLFFINNVDGATIYGKVYDFNLNPLNNVVIEINTKPEQSFIVKNFSYSFDLNPGNYVLTAKYYKNNKVESSLTQNISITQEGNYLIDLVLFPEFVNEEFEGVNIENGLFDESKRLSIGFIILIVIFLIIISFLVWKLKFLGDKKDKVEEKIYNIEEKTDLNKVIEILKREDGRINQKNLRKELQLSEAKVSLMIAELEHEGKIKKIKKGRGNIIILK